MTQKQIIFCKEYVRTRNATEAAKIAGYSEKTADSIGYENLQKPEIKAYIEEEFKKITKKYDFTEEDVRRGIHGVIESKDCKASDRLRGWELIGKILGVFKENNINVALFNEVDSSKIKGIKEALKKRAKVVPINKEESNRVVEVRSLGGSEVRSLGDSEAQSAGKSKISNP